MGKHRLEIERTDDLLSRIDSVSARTSIPAWVWWSKHCGSTCRRSMGRMQGRETCKPRRS
ncbi:hypothetical protein SAMN05880590_12017 [Rhizobium sp. RU35A]|nr:hypothetical protein SAMN05880590_12017 [Rhizobium sp. RU35A]